MSFAVVGPTTKSFDPPKDVWSSIISLLDELDAWNASKVCKAWQAVLTEECHAALAPQWHRAEANLAKINHLSIIFLCQYAVSRPLSMIKLPHIVDIAKWMWQETDRCAERFRSMKLNLDDWHLSSFTWGKYKNIVKLEIKRSNVSFDPTAFRTILQAVPNLRDLSYNACTRFDFDTIRRDCRKLRALKASMMTDDGRQLFHSSDLVQLNSLTSLTDLTLHKVETSDPHALQTALSSLSTLKRFRISQRDM